MTGTHDVAIVIGVNRNERLDTSVLTCAEADAAALEKLFHRRGLHPRRVLTFIGPQATRDHIMSALDQVRQRFAELDAGHRVWFCFSGHGVVDAEGRAHLLVSDAYYGPQRGAIGNSLVVEEVRERLRGGDAAGRSPNVIMLLDACRSRVRSPGRDIAVDFQDHVRRLMSQRSSGTVIFFGCSQGQLSYEDGERGLGVFTAAFIDVLSRPNPPRTVAELYDRLTTQVLDGTHRANRYWTQVPALLAEPAELKDGLILFPHLLSDADVEQLCELAASHTSWQSALSLLENLSRLRPGDGELEHRISVLSARGPAPRPVPSLETASGLNLGPLHDALRTGRWREADLHTRNLVIKAAGRDPVSVANRVISLDEIARISVSDLLAVDDLWRLHSRGRFGFTAQLDAARNVHEDVTAFADLVGWRRARWIWYSEANWSSSAPDGHLPILGPSGGIKPPWPFKARHVLRASTTPFRELAEIGPRARRLSRLERLHLAQVTEAFGWREYFALAESAHADLVAGLGRGRFKPLGEFVGEAPIGKQFSAHAQLLSVVWAITRIHLLRRLAETR